MAATCDIIPQIKNKEGQLVESTLFTNLLSSGMKRKEAINAYNLIYTGGYKAKYGDWEYFPSKFMGELDENGQPTLDSLKPFLPSSLNASFKEATLEDSARKIEGLTDTFAKAGVNVDIKFDNTLDENANVQGTGENSARITLNPKKVFKDTIPHEFGHIYVDMLGDNPIVQQGISQLENSPLATEIKKKYPTLDANDYGKELLTTAIGKEASQLFDNPEAIRRWNFFLSRLFRAIGELFGVQPNVAKQLAVDMVSGKLKERRGEISKKVQQQRASIEEVQAHVKEKGYKLSDDKTHYVSEELERAGENFEFKRGTEELSRMVGNEKKGEEGLPIYEKFAREKYKKAERQFSEKITVDGKELDYDQLVEYMRMKQNTDWRMRGNIVHAIIQNIINPSKELVSKLSEMYNGVKGESFAIDPEEYTWVEEKIGEIFDAVGINIYDKNVKEKDKDKLVSEITVASKLMGIATTIDSLVKHANGLFSIIDWKTGNLLSDTSYANFMKYGKNQIEHITDSKLHKAKLEVVLRAMILKESMGDKDVFFQNLTVAGISKNDPTKVYEINPEPYLGILEDYYSDAANGKLDVYEQLKAKGLFDPTNYIGHNEELENDKTKNMSRQEKLKYWTDQQRLVNNKIKRLEKGKGSYSEIGAARDESKAIVDEIARLNAELGENPTADDVADMGFIKRWIGNMNSTNNPRLQNFFKLLSERKKSARQRIDELKNTHDELLKKVRDEYFRDNGMQNLIKNASLGAFNGLKYKGFYDFMWEDKKSDTKDGKYARVITQAQVDAGTYSQAQYEYNKFVRETMKEEYEKVVNKIAYYRGKHAVTVWEAQGLPEKLSDDFMARYMMSGEEAIEKNGFTGKGSRDYFVNSMLSDFTETQYNPTDKQSSELPVKYLGSDDIIKSGNHTLSTEIAFKNFISNIIMKDEMDDMQALGDGIVDLLKTKTDNQGEEFKNTIEFLQDQILLHVSDTKKKPKWTRKSISFTHNGQKKTISLDKLLRIMKSWVSYSAMWLKPIPAMFNTALIVVMNANKAVVGSIAKRLPGANPEDYAFTVSHLIRAHGNYVDFLTKSMLGKKEDSKLWQLAKHLDYLPDNYDYATRKNELVVSKNKILDKSNLYMFHSIGEEYGNLILLGAQAHHYKMGSKSMWDSYEMVDGRLKYTGDRSMKLADGTTLTELSALEINSFKRVSAQIHGGYRQDERTALDLTALGQLGIQFKKYLPNVLESLAQSKYKDQSMGKYELKQKDGEDVYTWVGRVNEGRAIVLGKWFTAMVRLDKDPTYKWSNLPPEQKQKLLDLLIVGSFFAFMNIMNAALYGGGDDDDDKLTDWDKMISRKLLKLADDQSQGVAFWDVLNSIQSQATALPKLYKTSKAFKEFMLDGLIMGKRTQRGDIPGANMLLGQSVPLSTSWKDVSRYIDSDNDTKK